MHQSTSPVASFHSQSPAPRPRKRRHPKPRPRPRPNPRSSWPAWTSEERWTITEARDLAEVPSYEPTPAAEAFHCGWNLGYEHDATAGPDASLAPPLQLSWRAGWAAGWASRDEVDALIDRRQAANSITDADMWPGGVC